jgi:hypothetical protein
MMKSILILLTVVCFSFNITAQTAEDSVKAAVNKLFDGMKNADAIMVTEAFTDSAILQTFARNQEGKLMIRNERVRDFADFVSKQKKGAADERIEFETIKIDGPLAIAWTPYNFYFDGKFSHCGVNSFQLVRIDGRWKIQYLIDTRRRESCNEK